MTNVGYATLTVIPSAKGFSKALAGEVNPAATAAGKHAGNEIGGGIAGGLKGLVKPAIAALSVGSIVAGFRSAITAASDLGESVNAVNVIFGDAAEGVLNLGRNAARTVGLSNSQFNGLAVQFSAFAKTIAGEGGDVVFTLSELTGRAADFASVMNLDVNEAATLFQSGLAGETEPLRKFGIDLSAAAVEAYAYANGIATAGSELTEAQKVQARYGLLLQSTAATSDDFANTQFSLANGLRILGASWKDVQAKLGSGLLPFAAAGVAAVNALMPALSSFAQGFADFGARMQAVYDEAGGGGAGFRAMVESIIGSIGSFFSGGGLSSIFEGIAAARSAFFQAITNAIPGLVDGIVAFLPQLVTTLTTVIIPGIVNEFVAIVGTLATQIARLLPTVAEALLGLLPVISEALLRMAPGVLTAALDLFQRIAEAVVRLVPALIEALVGILPPLISTLVSMLPVVLTAAISLFSGLVDGVVQAIPLILAAITGALPSIVTGLLSLIPGLVTGALTLFSALADGLLAALPAILSALLGILPSLVTTLTEMLPGLIEGALGFFLGLVNALVETIPTLLSALLGALPDIVRTLVAMLPALIVGAIDLFMGLVFGLLDVLPELLGTLLVEVLPSLISTLIQMIPQLVQASVLLFAGIITGLVTNIPTLIGRVASLVPEVVAELGKGLPKLAETGIDMIEGLVQGFLEAGPQVADTLLGIIEGAVGGVLDFLGIKSPSRLFMGIAGDTVDGMTIGLERGAPRVAKASEALIPTAPEIPTATVGAGGGVLGALASAAGSGGIAFSYTQVGGQGLTSEQEVERAARRLKQSLRK